MLPIVPRHDLIRHDQDSHTVPRIQAKGQVTLERHLRDAVGLRPGDEVEERLVRPGDAVEEAGILVTARRAGFSRFRGLLGKGRTKDVMAELRDA